MPLSATVDSGISVILHFAEPVDSMATADGITVPDAMPVADWTAGIPTANDVLIEMSNDPTGSTIIIDNTNTIIINGKPCCPVTLPIT